ncbi:hypothetical protein KVF89_29365 [Nocardioides carbamazepini]|uniref:hypothetical protein n=1 Tax=Nocardioides carbamazepini TaxID=2854259 RepID=UPI002149DB1A|nr:hypothetical protein [Nocardioides carbamazepini]MCR1786681.1 hypothetical protein [Nocardioides carbamazepini]
MSERLRDLLEQAVPDDAPTFEPHALAATARRRRDRGRAMGAGLAAVILVGAATAAVVGTRGDDRDQVAQEPTSAPYDVPPCPARLPDPATEDATYPGTFDGLVGLRLCPDPAAPETPDALTEVDDLTGRLAALDEFDPARCAAISVIPSRQSLLFVYDDGTSVLTPASPCVPSGAVGLMVDGGDLVSMYLDALADQRDHLAYSRPYDGAFDCAATPAPSPAGPGRERIVSGAVCRGYGESPAEPLSEDQLRRVADAWDAPGPLVLGKCSPPEPVRLLLGTDRGDVVEVQDGCVALTWPGRDEDGGASLPVSMAELGLTP